MEAVPSVNVIQPIVINCAEQQSMVVGTAMDEAPVSECLRLSAALNGSRLALRVAGDAIGFGLARDWTAPAGPVRP